MTVTVRSEESRAGWAWFFVALAMLTLAGGVVRWHFLDYPMRYDESHFYLTQCPQSVWYIATHWSHVLHSLLMRVSSHFFGTSPAALRLPVFLAGVSLIPLTACLAWSLSRRRDAALLAALAACGSSLLVEYSANARGYSIQAVFVTLAAIATIRLMADPVNRWLWMGWGGLGVLGAYTQPTMVLPMTVFGAALLIETLRASRGSVRRRALARGLTLGSFVCVAGSTLLWVPIFVSEGMARVSFWLGLADKVYKEYLVEQGGMLPAMLKSWVRHSHVAWGGILGLGFVGFTASAMLKPGARNLVPLLMLLALPAVVFLLGTPMVPPSWLFMLPMVFACSMIGICQWCNPAGKTVASRIGLVVVAVVIVSATSTMVNVSRQPYLSTWDHEIVDIKDILAEYEASGADRTALCIRHHPATRYYRMRRGLGNPLSPESPGVQRVLIAVGTLRTLDDLWNADVPGFNRFHAPRLQQTFSRSKLYVAEKRASEHAQAP